VIKSRIVRLVGHVLSLGEKINTRFWWGEFKIEDEGDD
jgi:hypothetical protein